MINDTTASASGEKCKDCDGLGFHVVEVLTASGVQEIGEPCTTCRVTAQQTERMQPGRDAPKIKTWQERTGNHNIRPGSVKHMIAEIADLRAALARAPLPAQSQDAERFRKAIALEDNAEALYAAVLSNAPDADAIRAEFDASIAASLAGKVK